MTKPRMTEETFWTMVAQMGWPKPSKESPTKVKTKAIRAGFWTPELAEAFRTIFDQKMGKLYGVIEQWEKDENQSLGCATLGHVEEGDCGAEDVPGVNKSAAHVLMHVIRSAVGNATKKGETFLGVLERVERFERRLAFARQSLVQVFDVLLENVCAVAEHGAA